MVLLNTGSVALAHEGPSMHTGHSPQSLEADLGSPCVFLGTETRATGISLMPCYLLLRCQDVCISSLILAAVLVPDSQQVQDPDCRMHMGRMCPQHS